MKGKNTIIWCLRQALQYESTLKDSQFQYYNGTGNNLFFAIIEKRNQMLNCAIDAANDFYHTDIPHLRWHQIKAAQIYHVLKNLILKSEEEMAI